MKEIETIITGDGKSYLIPVKLLTSLQSVLTHFSNPVNTIIVRMEDSDGNLIKKLVFTDKE